jgi:hypothetical protein
MKTHTLLAAILFAMPAAAQRPTGHVLSAEAHSSHHSTSLYNSSNGQYSNGSGVTVEGQTDIQVGNLIYESPRIHKQVQVGKDYPVNIETDKHGVAKKLDVIDGEKKYTYRITGTREAKSN